MNNMLLIFALTIPMQAAAYAQSLPEMVRSYTEIRKKVEREIDPYFPNVSDTKEQIEHREFSIHFMQFLLAQCLKSKQCAFRLMYTSLQGHLKSFVVEHITQEVVEKMRRNNDVIDEGAVREIVLKKKGSEIEREIRKKNRIVHYLDNYELQSQIIRAIKNEQDLLFSSNPQGAGFGAGPRSF